MSKTHGHDQSTRASPCDRFAALSEPYGTKLKLETETATLMV
jgi:hypothetical protein